MKSFGSYFSEKVRNRKSVFGLRRRVRIAYEPIPWSAQGDPKIKEKNKRISEPLFLAKIRRYTKIKKTKRSPNGWLSFGGGASWAALGTLLAFQSVLWPPEVSPSCFSEPTAPPKCPQRSEIASKINSKSGNNCSRRVQKCKRVSDMLRSYQNVFKKSNLFKIMQFNLQFNVRSTSTLRTIGLQHPRARESSKKQVTLRRRTLSDS